jgi:hypothetical protein
MTMALGDPVGTFTFLQADGTPIELQAFIGKPLLLVFLRHLA